MRAPAACQCDFVTLPSASMQTLSRVKDHQIRQDIGAAVSGISCLQTDMVAPHPASLVSAES